MPAEIPDTSHHDAKGDFFAEYASTNATNAHVDRPAMLGLGDDHLGDVAGLDVLDVGCGPGFHAAALLGRGATVTGIDGSATLPEQAREVTGGRATLHHHNLEQRLDFAADRSYGLSLMALDYHHVHDRPQLLTELRRVLRPGGRMLISTTHPTAEQRWLGGSYFAGGRVETPVDDGKFSIDYERMTLETLLNELIHGGFTLERIGEPRPIEALRDVDPERYERMSTDPTILTLALRRS
jgi:SAM-dependent methyltransferase